jgi:hypothetical protein
MDTSGGRADSASTQRFMNIIPSTPVRAPWGVAAHGRACAVALVTLVSAAACKSTEPAPEVTAPAPNVAAAPPPAVPGSDGAWENLLPSATLEGFQRVPIDPLASKTVWQPRPDGVLFIDGVGAKEMLLSEREFGDGRLQVEWRFLPAQPTTPDAAPVYNGGVYVRTALDGKSWVQLQVARAEKPPVVGDLIAQVPGRTERIDVFQAAAAEAPPVGDWVRYDITLSGPRIELRVDGRETIAWTECPLLTGHVGLQAEGAAIEVRSLKFQPL